MNISPGAQRDQTWGNGGRDGYYPMLSSDVQKRDSFPTIEQSAPPSLLITHQNPPPRRTVCQSSLHSSVIQRLLLPAIHTHTYRYIYIYMHSFTYSSYRKFQDCEQKNSLLYLFRFYGPKCQIIILFNDWRIDWIVQKMKILPIKFSKST